MKYAILGVLIFLIALPLVIGVAAASDTMVFNGFLINIPDNYSYIGKMREGWLGSWQFSMLSASIPPGKNYLYLFYIFLGHVARWLGLPLILTFHATRGLALILLWYQLCRFVDVYLERHDTKTKNIALLLLCFGSGMGWMAVILGGQTGDFWIPEAYPFLSMYTNPHFPLGMALMVDFFIQLRKPFVARDIVPLALKGMFLGITMQFGVVIAGIVAGGAQLWEIIKKQYPIRWWMLWFLIPGGLVLVYQFIVLRTDPVLREWDIQNITLTPPIWNILVSFSPVLLLAIGMIIYLIRSDQVAEHKLLVVWFVAGLILAYFPFQLQRRFLLGYYIPAASLGAIAIGWAYRQKRKLFRTAAMLVVTASFITNLVIISSTVKEIGKRNPDLFYPVSMQTAFEWMLNNRPAENVILSAPRTGAFIPGETGWRVVYGHHVETPDAYNTQLTLEQIFYGMKSTDEIMEYIETIGADYVFIGPLERKFGGELTWVNRFPVVYENAEVTIYKTGVDS